MLLKGVDYIITGFNLTITLRCEALRPDLVSGLLPCGIVSEPSMEFVIPKLGC